MAGSRYPGRTSETETGKQATADARQSKFVYWCLMHVPAGPYRTAAEIDRDVKLATGLLVDRKELLKKRRRVRRPSGIIGAA